MKKLITAFFAMSCLSILLCVPALAATTGWAVENGQTVYYDNGVKVSNVWVANGANYYYVNALGYTSPAWVITAANGQLAGIAPVASSLVAAPVTVTTPSPVVPTVTPATTATTPAVTPVLVPGLPAVDVNTMTAQQRANYEDRLYQRHYYYAGYSFVDDDVHKAYCGCGEWIYEGHNYVDCEIDGKTHKKCSLCE